MRLVVRRLGGIAGVTLRTPVDTTDLPPEEADAVERTIRDRAGSPPSPSPHPDAFRYEISAPDERELTPIVLHEHEIPPELRGLVQAVKSSGELERRDPSEQG
jgi:emfourin